MKALRGCLLWLAIYALIATGIMYLVERRIGAREPATGVGAIAGFIVWWALSNLTNAARNLRELYLIRRSVNGAEPSDGARIAAVGTITPSGRTLSSPISNRPAVAYTYQIHTSISRKWEGAALVPSSIRSGTNSLRLLALPELDFPKTREGGAAHAVEYVRKTAFPTHKDGDDGMFRHDAGPSGEPQIVAALMMEQVVEPGDAVCVFGTYSAARTALVAPARLIKGEPAKLMAARGSTVVWSVISATLMLAGVTAALALLYAVIPLDVVKQPSWREIQLEGIVEKHVRPRIAPYVSMLPIIVPLGENLQPGEARGRIRTAHGEAAMTNARGEWTADAIEVTLLDGPRPVATLTLSPSGELRAATLLSRPAPIPPARLVVGPINPNEIAGRLSAANEGVHAVFRVGR